MCGELLLFAGFADCYLENVRDKACEADFVLVAFVLANSGEVEVAFRVFGTNGHDGCLHDVRVASLNVFQFFGLFVYLVGVIGDSCTV